MLCLPQACGKHLRRGAEVRAHNDDRRPHDGACVKAGNLLKFYNSYYKLLLTHLST